ncbi:hypothetical protein LTR08_000787 [Meristemomyces frigidus]|nr:hypothetical protein LTR08_000787 [Meristemomyces frigidus]
MSALLFFLPAYYSALARAFSLKQTLSPESMKADAEADVDGSSASIPPPLNVPPSRARRQLAARLAQRRREAEVAEGGLDVEEADMAVRVSGGGGALGPAGDGAVSEVAGLQITGLRPVGGLQGGTARRFSGLFGSDDSSSSGVEDDDEDEDEDEDDDEDEDEESAHEGGAAGPRGLEHAQPTSLAPAGGVGRRRSQRGGKGRRPSTTEAKERTLLDDDEADEDFSAEELGLVMEGGLRFGHDGEGPFADPEELGGSSSEDELVEIKPRRAS